MKISIDLIQQLREKTGIGLGLCKKALEETGGVIEDAIDWLKKQGHAQASKVADRETTQGLMAFAKHNNVGSLIILSCETDFVSGNEQFGKFAHDVAMAAAVSKANTLEDLKTAKLENGMTVEAGLLELISSIKENIKISDVKTLIANSNEQILGYVYRTKMNQVPDIGSRACMIAYKTNQDNANKDNSLTVKDVAMHIVANNTQYLNSEDIPEDFIQKEKALFRERMLLEGKPENMLDKIIEGKVGQMHKEHALLHQMFFKDPSVSISQYLSGDVEIISFINAKI